jgi:putative oxidoreductase
LSDLAVLILRVIVGGIFVLHGYDKTFGSNPGLAGFLGWIGSTKTPLPNITGRFAAYGELLGGLGLILGVGGFVAPLTLGSIMVAAIAIAHKQLDPRSQNGGWEFAGVLLAINTALALLGNGAYSLDAFL